MVGAKVGILRGLVSLLKGFNGEDGCSLSPIFLFQEMKKRIRSALMLLLAVKVGIMVMVSVSPFGYIQRKRKKEGRGGVVWKKQDASSFPLTSTKWRMLRGNHLRENNESYFRRKAVASAAKSANSDARTHAEESHKTLRRITNEFVWRFLKNMKALHPIKLIMIHHLWRRREMLLMLVNR